MIAQKPPVIDPWTLLRRVLDGVVLVETLRLE
jgi:hypothetical protein